mmetsp:Transcript_5108/g.12806  ORF Transcript_5108/g.12806 Transcript_5108/m.12806 type:complete len:311 (-) Transcript_5108:52-984(-)
MGPVPTQKALQDALDRCEHAGTKRAAPPTDIRNLLKIIRDGKVRMPEVVSRHGTRLLSNHARSLRPDELWLVHEQVCEALLDTGDVSRAKDVVLKLDKRFPKSLRVAVLKGQLFECCEDYESAEEIYAHILEEDEAHQRARKRRVCVAKAQGKMGRAVELLKEYLDVFMTDAEAWEELACLYLASHLQQQAIFCYEELILLNPQEPRYHLKLADLMHALGGGQGATGSSGQKVALAHYAVVLELTNGCSVHAMYGVLACSNLIKHSSRGQQGKLSDEEENLVRKVQQKLKHVYENANPELGKYMQEALIT